MAKRIGMAIGGLLANAVHVAAGYVWAKHGIEWAAAVYGSTLATTLMLYGALTFPWRTA